MYLLRNIWVGSADPLKSRGLKVARVRIDTGLPDIFTFRRPCFHQKLPLLCCTLSFLISLTECLQLDEPKLNQPKWNFSTFCGLYGTTSYPQLPLRRIDPPHTRSHPQGGVQIYLKGKFIRQNHEKKNVMLPFLLNSHITVGYSKS